MDNSPFDGAIDLGAVEPRNRQELGRRCTGALKDPSSVETFRLYAAAIARVGDGFAFVAGLPSGRRLDFLLEDHVRRDVIRGLGGVIPEEWDDAD